MENTDQVGINIENSNSKEEKLPEWPAEIFKKYTENHIQIDQIVELSKKGLSMLKAQPELIKALIGWKKVNSENNNSSESDLKIEYANHEAQLATTEIEKDFPILHSQALISIWGNLEAFIKSYIVELLRNEPKAMKAETLKKIKISFGEYESLELEEKYFYLVDLLEIEVRAPLKQGISHFEALLEVFSLSGTFSEEDRRNLYELYHIRNVLVHRRGIADRKFIESCPYLNYKIGNPISINNDTYSKYKTSVFKYYLEILYRSSEYYGHSIRKP